MSLNELLKKRPKPKSSLSDLLAHATPAKIDVIEEAAKALENGRYSGAALSLVPAPPAPIAPPGLFRKISMAGPRPKAPALPKAPPKTLKDLVEDSAPIKTGPFRSYGVSESAELDRIVRLPRRSLDPTLDLTSVFRREGGTMTLRPIQSAALHDMALSNGLLAPIGVGHGKCADGDTELYDTENGRRRKLSELGAFRVATMRIPGTVTESPAVSFPSGIKPCVKLTIVAGAELVVSTDHPIYTPKGWATADSLHPDDLIATPRYLPEPAKNTEIDDDTLKFIAYMMADGATTYTLQFTKSIPSILEDFSNIVRRLGGNVRDTYSRSCGKATTLAVLGMTGLIDRWDLRALSKEKRVPAVFWGLSNRQIALFSNIFWGCDGYISPDGYFEMCLASERLIDDLAFMLTRLGIAWGKHYKPVQLNGKSFDAWRLTVTSRPDVLRFLNAIGDLKGREERCQHVRTLVEARTTNTNKDIVPITQSQYEEICDEMKWPGRGCSYLGASRKRTAARRFLGVTVRKDRTQYVSRELFAKFCKEFDYQGKYAWLADSDIYWRKVKSVESVGEREVYDLSVPETGSFIANGIVVHNTLVTLLAPTAMKSARAVLFIPPQLRTQLLQKNIPDLNKHWRLPLDRLTVVAYSELSSAKSFDLLDQLKPDLIIFDEIHLIKNRGSARTKRVLRYYKENPGCRLVGLSGTITSKSLLEFSHLSELALRARSPVPLNYHTLMEWNEALSVTKDPLPPGALRRLGTPQEIILMDSKDRIAAQQAARSAFRRRLVETPGVVATEEGAIGTSLVLRGLAPTVPPEVEKALKDLRETWSVGEEELIDILSVIRVGCQLAGGFHYRWVWPGGEPDREWLDARREWNRELREILKLSRKGMDSPMLVERAISRGEYRSDTYAAWEAVKGRYRPHPPREAVWHSDYMVKAALEWAEGCNRASPGIIWYVWEALGEAIAAAGALPFFGPGTPAAEALAAVDAKKTPVIVCSQHAHGEGKNLQDFCRNLFTTPMSGGKAWEQTLGRTHRPLQQADEVTADIMVPTEEMRKAFQSALKDAEYVETSQGQKQKLNYATRLNLPDAL